LSRKSTDFNRKSFHTTVNSAIISDYILSVNFFPTQKRPSSGAFVI